MPTLERSLVLLKPDVLSRGLVGRLIQRFEDAGLKIIGMKMQRIDADLARAHYFDVAERHGESVLDALTRFMSQGPVVAMAVEGVSAVSNIRKLVGPTFPDQAAPGTIRGDFAHHSKASTEEDHKAVANLVHASGNLDEAKAELELWFRPDELHDYSTLAERLTF